MKKEQVNKKLYSAPEVAKMLGISRTAVFKKIKNGQLKAQLVGGTYAINGADILIGNNLPQSIKTDIQHIVEKALIEYKEAFQRLAAE